MTKTIHEHLLVCSTCRKTLRLTEKAYKQARKKEDEIESDGKTVWNILKLFNKSKRCCKNPNYHWMIMESLDLTDMEYMLQYAERGIIN